MATNDFLVVAPGPAPNVASQATYAADTIVTTGNVSGVAKSAIVNKAWRQSSIMASVLAQLIVDNTGQNAVDDGTISTLLANLKAGLAGRLLAVRPFTASTTYTPTTGTRFIITEVQAGGGAGGGSAITTSGQVSAGNGGSSGSYVRALIPSGFSGLSITVGTAGSGASAANGSAGGGSSFGTLVTSPGGAGGIFNGAGTASGVGGGTAPTNAGTVTGVAQLIEATRGEGGFQGAATSVTNSIGGKGGGNRFGCGGYSTVGTGTGIVGTNYGTGGSGAAVGGGSAVAFAGGNGLAGIVIIWEFA